MPPSKKPVRFIEFLDSYDKTTQYDYVDYTILNCAIQTNVLAQRLTDASFSGIRYKKEEHITKYLGPTLDASTNYFKNYQESIWNESTDPFKFSFSTTPYGLWQREHETDIRLPTTPIQIPKTRKLIIDASIQTLDDVLGIVDKHAYEADVDYNIDLKSLHNIKTELVELNNMIGMESMKKSVLEQLIYFIQELHIGKDKDTSDFKHTVIYGPPGTGKTEIAKIIGRMYSKLGILNKNVFKKVTRNDLIAGYLGQTAIKTKKVVEECVGGVMFIDEAYSLANSDREDSYSKECLDILCESLSDHKNDLMVIIAGYEDELNETFFKTNRGLESRFIWRFSMEAYTAKELMEIFKKKVVEIGWSFENEADVAERWFQDKLANFKHFGRDMELLLTYVKISHGRRVYGKESALRKKISVGDMKDGYDVFMKNKKQKKEQPFMHGIYV
jgi:SpoVK/Ycf46/Vps4 family AAA+-type ATPase